MGRLSNEDYKLIKELVDKKTSVEELAEMYGLSINGMYYHMNKVGYGKKRREFKQVEIESMVELFNNGYSFKKIGEQYGVSAETVRTKIRNKVNFDKKVIKKCNLCTSEFEVSRKSVGKQKYCSEKCAKVAANKRNCGGPVEKECRLCGKSFKTHKTTYNLQKYCSNACRMKDHYINNKKIVYRNCKYCSDEFEVGERRIFCSEECSNKQEELEKKKRWRFKKCKYCERWHYRYKSVYCSENCSTKAKRLYDELRKSERLERARKNGQFDADIDIYKLIERDGGHCYLCGDDVLFACHYNDPKYPTIEHVIPIAKGGTHSWGNVKVACRECNTRKSTTLIDDFMKGGE